MIRGLAAVPLRLRRARLERVDYATTACPLRNMSYVTTNMFYKYESTSEEVWPRFPYTLTKPSQRVRVTWVGHRSRASEFRMDRRV